MTLSFAYQSLAGLCAKEQKAYGYEEDYFIQRAMTRVPAIPRLFTKQTYNWKQNYQEIALHTTKP